ncbi:MAG: DNA polymerase III subunit epsilon [Pseudomonadota bacterium]
MTQESKRQIVLDTETTGLEPADDHRIIEIGCVEIINRRVTGNTWHRYLNPDRRIDDGAIAVHGITNEDLADQPRFPEIADEFLEFIVGAELVIHNAPFDVGFLEHELRRMSHKRQRLLDLCPILDTLVLAREQHPGARNSLDALCKRYQVDNSGRELHGALLDARLLGDVYLLMTGGQNALFEDSESDVSHAAAGGAISESRPLPALKTPLKIPSAEELAAHELLMDRVGKACGGAPVWQKNQKLAK